METRFNESLRTAAHFQHRDAAPVDHRAQWSAPPSDIRYGEDTAQASAPHSGSRYPQMDRSTRSLPAASSNLLAPAVHATAQKFKKAFSFMTPSSRRSPSVSEAAALRLHARDAEFARRYHAGEIHALRAASSPSVPAVARVPNPVSFEATVQATNDLRDLAKSYAHIHKEVETSRLDARVKKLGNHQPAIVRADAKLAADEARLKLAELKMQRAQAHSSHLRSLSEVAPNSEYAKQLQFSAKIADAQKELDIFHQRRQLQFLAGRVKRVEPYAQALDHFGKSTAAYDLNAKYVVVTGKRPDTTLLHDKNAAEALLNRRAVELRHQDSLKRAELGLDAIPENLVTTHELHRAADEHAFASQLLQSAKRSELNEKFAALQAAQ